jgi:flagellar basal body-associated protein FliL
VLLLQEPTFRRNVAPPHIVILRSVHRLLDTAKGETNGSLEGQKQLRQEIKRKFNNILVRRQGYH